jgi:hypothetical protein
MRWRAAVGRREVGGGGARPVAAKCGEEEDECGEEDAEL